MVLIISDSDSSTERLGKLHILKSNVLKFARVNSMQLAPNFPQRKPRTRQSFIQQIFLKIQFYSVLFWWEPENAL